jgi:hypothetical protein
VPEYHAVSHEPIALESTSDAERDS